jgi:hypothetical protein
MKEKIIVAENPNFAQIYIIDGVPVKLIPKDIDKDGKVGGIETLQMKDMNEEQDIVPQSEMKEVISEMNEDKVNKEGMTSIDSKTVFTSMEKTAYHAYDALVSMGFLCKHHGILTRIGKRINPSVGGVGRQQIVEIIKGDRENKKSILDKALNMGQQKV